MSEIGKATRLPCKGLNAKGNLNYVCVGMALALIRVESLLRYFKISPLLPETVTNAHS